MNAVLKVNAVVINDGVVTLTGAINDPTGQYTTKSIVDVLTSLKLFAVCQDAGKTVYGEFTLDRVLEASRKSFTVAITNTNGLDMYEVGIPAGTDAFVCSESEGVLDVPSGVYLNVSPALTEWARTRNLCTLFSKYGTSIQNMLSRKMCNQVVQVADIVNDEQAEEGKRHWVILQHVPTEEEVMVEINGVASYEREPDGRGDFTVDRAAQVLYLDAYINDFSFEDLQNSAVEIRIRYWYIDTNELSHDVPYRTMAQLYPNIYRTMPAIPDGTFPHKVNLEATSTMESLFAGCAAITTIPVLTTSQRIMNMANLFAGCSSLTTVDLSNWNTTSVMNMNGVFDGCAALESVDISSFTTSTVTTMIGMFTGCASLLAIDLSGMDTARVVKFANFLEDCAALESVDVSTLNMSMATDVSQMFAGCRSLTTVDLSAWNTPNLDDTNRMFKNCSSLVSVDLAGLKTANVTDFSGMFEGCSALTSIDLSTQETHEVKDFSRMFAGCAQLASVNLIGLDTANAVDMHEMFRGCRSLPEVFPLTIDCSNITRAKSLNDMFTDSSVTTVNLKNVNQINPYYVTSLRLKGDDSLVINFL